MSCSCTCTCTFCRKQSCTCTSCNLQSFVYTSTTCIYMYILTMYKFHSRYLFLLLLLLLLMQSAAIGGFGVRGEWGGGGGGEDFSQTPGRGSRDWRNQRVNCGLSLFLLSACLSFSFSLFPPLPVSLSLSHFLSNRQYNSACSSAGSII